MHDPLSEVIGLLRPRTVFSKSISGAGRWAVRYSVFGQPSFCAVLDGTCRLAVDGERPLTLEAGDFLLLPATPAFTMSGGEATKPKRLDPTVTPSPTGDVRLRYTRRSARCAVARRVLRLRLTRFRVARVAAARAHPRARGREALGPGSSGGGGSEPRPVRPGTRADAARRGTAHRGATGRAQCARAAGTVARVGRCDAGPSDPTHARSRVTIVDGGSAGADGRALAVDIL